MPRPTPDYRLGVGIMLLNPEGQVFVGQRLDNSLEAWQMPQGGIDPGEDPWLAALRELQEETGVAAHLVKKLTESPIWLTYDLPPDVQPTIWGGKYRGQKQKWYLLRFLGGWQDVDLNAHEPEFRSWRWADAHGLPELIVPFKRPLYEEIITMFAEFLPQNASILTKR